MVIKEFFKGKVKYIINNKSGFIFLLVFPFTLLLFSSMLLITRSVKIADVDVQYVLGLAAKKAASQVSSYSQANTGLGLDGYPRIVIDRARLAFEDCLKQNLGLDNSLTPLPNSQIGDRIDYVLVVYNGDDKYGIEGAGTGQIISYINGIYSYNYLVASGFPCVFSIDNLNIVQGSNSGNIVVKLEKPGVVASVKASGSKVMSTDNIVTYRWAAARIVVQ